MAAQSAAHLPEDGKHGEADQRQRGDHEEGHGVEQDT